METRDLLYAKRKTFPRLRFTPFEQHEMDAISMGKTDWEHVETCLRSNHPEDIHAALTFLMHISCCYPINNLPFGLTDLFVSLLPTFMNRTEVNVRYRAQTYFVTLKEFFPQYREKMLELLNSEDMEDRRTPLYHYATFCRPGEIAPLIKFKDDESVTQTGMMGPWVYEFRNRALETIEKMLSRQFDKPLKQAPFEETTVSWYDWSAFLKWWMKNGQRKT